MASLKNEWPEFSYAKVHRAAFTVAECGQLVELAHTRGLSSADIGTVRRCNIAWIDFAHPLINRLIGFGCDGRFDIKEPFAGSAQVSCYGPGDEYNWHMDLGAGPMSLRKVTVVLELQSAPEGGGLEIFGVGDLNLLVGDVTVLPSFVIHRAKPVVAGRRWSAAAWLLGERPFR